jgi:DNA replication initiation complex subunit (GINS family)
MDVYSQIVERIIKQQESIIGPIAVEQAEHVPNLKVDWGKKDIQVSGDGAKVIDNLVDQYKELFGKISVEVCREAAAPLINKLPEGKLPKTLA